MDPAAKEIIVRQGRLYTEKILSAIMEAGFDLKAIPVSYTHLDVYKRQATICSNSTQIW